MEGKVRVRFAPSPTGRMHIGNVRTAIFNWFFARQKGGSFILRIEDTDQERSSRAALDSILDDMAWLGLTWDEGPGVGGPYSPYFQSQRLDLYAQVAEELIKRGAAYPCFCSQSRLEAQRERAKKAGRTPRYDGRCAQLDDEEVKERVDSGDEYTVRLDAPRRGRTEIDDLVHGKVVFQNEDVDDFVLMKSNGLPTYNFACVVDDHHMDITHVIRGDDHLSNTPKQRLIYEALNWEWPAFAHVPMILGPDGSRLSKRHGAVGVDEFRDKGIINDALVNYLALLGWGLSSDKEIFTRDELVGEFSLRGISPDASIFDTEKLEWMNGKYIRRMSDEEYVDLAQRFLKRSGLTGDSLTKEEEERVEEILLQVKTRIRVLQEVPDLTRFFFQKPDEYEAEGVAKYFDQEGVVEVLRREADVLEQVESWDRQTIEDVCRSSIEEMDIDSRLLIHPTRLALTGRTRGPGIFITIKLVGRNEACARLRTAARFIGEEMRS